MIAWLHSEGDFFNQMRRVGSSFFSVTAGIFYCLLVINWSGVDTDGEIPAAVTAMQSIGSLLLPSLLTTWVLADARQRGRHLFYDAGLFFYFAWVLLIPIYLVRTRGWRGVLPIVAFALLAVAAVFLGSMISVAAPGGD